MPSTLPVPTITDHLQAGKRAIIATRDELADERSGAIYDFFMGTAALAWAREAQADRDKFRAIYFHTAENDDLTTYVAQRFGIARVLDSTGQGHAFFVRPSAAGGQGTIWAGTRFSVQTPTGTGIVYEVATSVACSPTQLVVPVAIQATEVGAGFAINNASGPLIDPLWDNSFTALGVYCQNGTTFEKAADFRARVAQALLDQRPGYPARIIQSMKDVGAAQVVLFPSNYQGTDSGINVAYVADAGFNAPPSLVIGCQVAAEGSRVLGADLEVFAMARAALSVSLTVRLWNDPSLFDTQSITPAVIAGVLQYFADPANAFAYKIDRIRGAAMRVSLAIQDVVVNTPTVDATFSSTAWPAVLQRYSPTASTIAVSITGPS